MSNSVTLVMSIYNSIDVLPITLPNNLRYFNRAVIIDGAYADFPHEGNGSSNDGTLEYLHEFIEDHPHQDLTLIEADAPWGTEIVKRNRYLQEVPDHGWWMMIDDDELIMRGSLKPAPLPEPYDSGSIQAINVWNAAKGLRENNLIISQHTRLFYKYRGMRYEGGHARLVNDETGVRYKTMTIPIIIWNLGYMRSPERQAAREAYYKSGKMH